jgi:DNA polymerase-3 subunit epsilon
LEKNEQDLEAMARALDASGQYRVLRRLETRSLIKRPDGSETRLGLFLDVETTGLDPSSDEIIELAMVPFTYGLDGHIFEIREAFQQFHEPAKPIPEAITALTGITGEMVAGKVLDPAAVTAFASDAALVVAHNAAFDRRFVERLSEVFTAKPWACSMSQIDWESEGFEGTKLVYLAMGAGFFYDRHRAANDCLAAIELLATRLPKSHVPAMASLLERARRPSWRIWAENSPFELKDALKARGYRWNGEGNLNPRAWYVDVDDDAKDRELAYLHTEIYRRKIELPVRKITAYERFSDRS